MVSFLVSNGEPRRSLHHNQSRPCPSSAFTTRSEIIVPVLDWHGQNVVGTIDIESEEPNAFSPEERGHLEACSRVIRPLWLC